MAVVTAAMPHPFETHHPKLASFERLRVRPAADGGLVIGID